MAAAIVGLVGGIAIVMLGILLVQERGRAARAEERAEAYLAQLLAQAIPGEPTLVFQRLLDMVVPKQRDEDQPPAVESPGEYEPDVDPVLDWTDLVEGMEPPREMVAGLRVGQSPVEAWREQGQGAFDEWMEATPGQGSSWVEPIVLDDGEEVR